jgi:hypothetical protein
MKTRHKSFHNPDDCKEAADYAQKNQGKYVKIRVKDYPHQFGVVRGDSYFYAIVILLLRRGFSVDRLGCRCGRAEIAYRRLA